MKATNESNRYTYGIGFISDRLQAVHRWFIVYLHTGLHVRLCVFVRVLAEIWASVSLNFGMLVSFCGSLYDQLNISYQQRSSYISKLFMGVWVCVWLSFNCLIVLCAFFFFFSILSFFRYSQNVISELVTWCGGFFEYIYLWNMNGSHFFSSCCRSAHKRQDSRKINWQHSKMEKSINFIHFVDLSFHWFISFKYGMKWKCICTNGSD